MSFLGHSAPVLRIEGLSSWTLLPLLPWNCWGDTGVAGSVELPSQHEAGGGNSEVLDSSTVSFWLTAQCMKFPEKSMNLAIECFHFKHILMYFFFLFFFFSCILCYGARIKARASA